MRGTIVARTLLREPLLRSSRTLQGASSWGKRAEEDDAICSGGRLVDPRGGIRPRLCVRTFAKPRTKGVESYQTIKVLCKVCSSTLFKYKKKNGLKSSLVKW